MPVMTAKNECARCSTPVEDPTNTIRVTRGVPIGNGKSGRVRPVQDLICLGCWYNGGPKPPEPVRPKVKQTLPYKTLDDASERARKVAEVTGVPLPDVAGNLETGFAVIGDNSLVPGYRGNPWADKA